jgi:hypothetical protein
MVGCSCHASDETPAVVALACRPRTRYRSHEGGVPKAARRCAISARTLAQTRLALAQAMKIIAGSASAPTFSDAWVLAELLLSNDCGLNGDLDTPAGRLSFGLKSRRIRIAGHNRRCLPCVPHRCSPAGPASACPEVPRAEQPNSGVQMMCVRGRTTATASTRLHDRGNAYFRATETSSRH